MTTSKSAKCSLGLDEVCICSVDPHNEVSLLHSHKSSASSSSVRHAGGKSSSLVMQAGNQAASASGASRVVADAMMVCQVMQANADGP